MSSTAADRVAYVRGNRQLPSQQQLIRLVVWQNCLSVIVIRAIGQIDHVNSAYHLISSTIVAQIGHMKNTCQSLPSTAVGKIDDMASACQSQTSPVFNQVGRWSVTGMKSNCLIEYLIVMHTVL